MKGVGPSLLGGGGRGCWCHGGGGGALQGVCWGLGRQHLASVAWLPPRDALRTPQPILQPQHASSLKDSLSQKQSHPRAPSPVHRGRGNVQPSAGDRSGWVVATERPEEGRMLQPVGPWGDGHPSATENLPGFRSEHGLPHRPGPCQCEQMSSGKSLWPLLRPAAVKEIPHPTQPGQGLAHTRPTPQPAPSPRSATADL